MCVCVFAVLACVFRQPDDTKHWSIAIDFLDLLDAHTALAHLMLAHADRMLPLANEGLLQAQHQLYAISDSDSKPSLSVKQHWYV
jgi:hypothetical protein